GTSGSSGTDTSKDTSKDGETGTGKPAAPEPIELGADAVSVYDPYPRATETGAPVDAYDGDPETAWDVKVADGSQQMGVGLVVDLGSKRGVRVLELTTGTPGFRTEVYATDSSEVPPDVLDTRWAHVKDASDVGSGDKGKERIVLGGGSTKYRHVLIWLTTPPKDGPSVEISELSLLG
ncbi:MAG: hypothetical protein HZB46_00655, partial [Solirubrobacterales bacterium]|nr:hypothetical protein [Solirubrobacterales bacterium]